MNGALKATAGLALSVGCMTFVDASDKSAGHPMIVQHADGTFTIQKKAPDASSCPGGGLVIAPQVVVPLAPATTKKPRPYIGPGRRARNSWIA